MLQMEIEVITWPNLSIIHWSLSTNKVPEHLQIDSCASKLTTCPKMGVCSNSNVRAQPLQMANLKLCK